jgi:hypothetical protein
MRTGANPLETTLTPANVNSTTFGKLGQLPVDGQVYAQPLYKSNVTIPGQGTHNVIYVATEHDSVYAFDADNFALLWHDSFINPGAGVTPVPSVDIKSHDLTPEVGITGTPIIDPASKTLYVLDKVKDVSGGFPRYAQHLHALDLATGAEKFGGPVEIHATVRGHGGGNVGGKISFNPLIQFSRVGLLLLDGVVYIAWASHGDVGPYHGWVMGYTAKGLRQVSVFNTTPDSLRGGIWMSGGALAADANHNIYLATGNGGFNANKGGRDYGDSVIKLSTRNGLRVVDYFTPSNQAALSARDLDLGSGGVLVLPDQPGAHPHMLLIAGKEGKFYLIDRDNMGRFGKTDKVVQEIPHAFVAMFSTPAYLQGVVYDVGAPYANPSQTDVLKAFRLSNGALSSPSTGSFFYGYPGSTPSISANGKANGIVWTLDNSGAKNSAPAILRAYDASDVSSELYDSTQAGSRDESGAAVKFTVPTVVNGKVYVGGNGALTIYGLLPPV